MQNGDGNYAKRRDERDARYPDVPEPVIFKTTY
jgi:hypothetical protein